MHFASRKDIFCIALLRKNQFKKKVIGKDKNVEYFFGWVDRELLAVVAPNVLSHSITVTDTLLRSVTYQHNGHDDEDDDDDDYTNRNNDGDDGETLLEKFGNKICRQCCRGNPIKSDFEIFEHWAFQTLVWGKALK